MGVSEYAHVYKTRLIDSGHVKQDGHGHVTFSLAYLREHLRSMTNFGTSGVPDPDPWCEFPAPVPDR